MNPDTLNAIIGHAERDYPNEACGFVFAGPRGERAVEIPNVVDRYHVRDPVRFPRTAQTAYLMDPKAQIEAMEAAEKAGEKLVVVYHSHADVGAYFSDEDKAQALSAGGEPLLPGVEYLVLSVRGRRCDALELFRYEGGGRWAQRSVPLPE